MEYANFLVAIPEFSAFSYVIKVSILAIEVSGVGASKPVKDFTCVEIASALAILAPKVFSEILAIKNMILDTNKIVCVIKIIYHILLITRIVLNIF